MRKTYPTDLSNAECSYIEPHIPTPKVPGRIRVYPLREEVLNVIFYIATSPVSRLRLT